MGRRGPIAMADNVRALRGTHPERAESKQAVSKVRLPPGVPQAPDDLGDEAKAEWARIVPTLDAKGLLAIVDRGVIASYCRAWAHACQAEELLGHGLTATDKNGEERKSPAWQIWREATSLAAALAKELLLTPNARLRATMPEAGDGDKAEDLLD